MAKLSNVIALTTGIVALFGAAVTASADGYVTRGGAVPCCQPGWNGFYVGINGGYGFAARDEGVTFNETFATLPFFGPAAVGSLSPAGGFGGFQIGGNLQLGSFVFGLEADFQWSDISDTSAGSVTPYLAPGGIATMTSKNSVGSFGTLRPRIGFAWDRTLVYATGGLAWGGITHELRWNDNFGFTAQDRTSSSQVGYVVGGGFEHAFSHNLSLKLEYQYIDLGSTSYKAAELFGAAATAFAILTDTHTDFHTVRIGLNYKFGDRREVPLK
jgi:outer membrane immunogenic protein